MQKAEESRAYLDAVLREYDSLRAESADARAAQRSIMAFGAIGASAVLTLASGAVQDLPLLSVALLLVVLPGLLTLSAALWVGEVTRMRRAGGYLRAVEVKVACALRKTVDRLESQGVANLPVAGTSFFPLEWEQWVDGRGRHRGPEGVATRHMSWLYAWVMSAARAAAVLVPLLAVAVAFTAAFPGEDWAWQWSTLVSAVAMCCLQVWVWSRLTAVAQTHVGQLWPKPVSQWTLGPKRLAPKALLFDLDGVLVDTVWLHVEAHNRAAAANDLLLTDDELEEQRGMSPKDFYKVVLRRRGRAAGRAKAIADRKEQEAARLASLRPVQACSGASKIIERALHEGLRVAVVSSALRDTLNQRLRDIGVDDCRLVLVSAEDVDQGKPAPDPYAKAIRRLQLDPRDCVAIEDAESGVQSAKAAGAYCVGVGDRGEDRLREADEVVQDLTELARRLGWRIR